MLDKGRQADLDTLRLLYSQTTDPETRGMIERTAQKILKEDLFPRIGFMRDALIQAHRRGDVEEVKDTHEFIKNKSWYHND